MSESVNKYYIQNSNVKETEQFDDRRVKEGKSIYEVLRVVDGVPLFLEEHLARFNNSARYIDKALTVTELEIKNNIRKLIEENSVYDGNIKFVLNYSDEGANFLLYFISHKYPSEDMYKVGVKTILHHAERINPNAKVINVGFREQVDKELQAKSAYEAILVNNKDNITEGSKSNIFLVKNNIVYTSLVEDVLPGVTRGRIINILNNLGIDVKETNINYKEVENMDALFITGTSPKVLPIKYVDDLVFESSTNTVVVNIMRKYNEIIKDYINNWAWD